MKNEKNHKQQNKKKEKKKTTMHRQPHWQNLDFHNTAVPQTISVKPSNISLVSIRLQFIYWVD